MKRIWTAMLLLFAAAGDAQETGAVFTLTGTINEPATNMVYLLYMNQDGKRVRDSSTVVNQHFRFTGNLQGTGLVMLFGTSDIRTREYTSVFAEAGEIQVQVTGNHFKDATVTGSRAHVDYDNLQQQYLALDKKWVVVLDTLAAIGKRSNAAWQEAKGRLLGPYHQEQAEINRQFILQHPASPVTAYLLYMNGRSFPADSVQQWFSRLPAAVQKSQYGLALVQQWAQEKEGLPGTMAKNIAGTDINGKPLQLANFKGKYVLVDFWASWCVPCRKGNPHLKELYAQYHDKGFDIIGVSDDDTNPDAWRKAVEKDGLPWHHVLRGVKLNKDTMEYDKTKDNTAGYNITGLPTKVLIDPSGKIIARYSGGATDEAALDQKLVGLFPM